MSGACGVLVGRVRVRLPIVHAEPVVAELSSVVGPRRNHDPRTPPIRTVRGFGYAIREPEGGR
ncbi:hypothetical protein [Streptomyces sp. NPDC086182]|jgi:hypothetical protein|uniref:hypothetical protein n=1 Tax=Streptomyces sp. NPDC086182 TaxID=3155058 RepID=UPI0034304DA5